MTWLGLDIGGANLKAASATGWSRSMPFALWRNPDGLGAALAALLEEAPAAVGLAVTMTGELCDCFLTKEEGVRRILSAVETIAAGRNVSVFLVDGRFVCVSDAHESCHLAAASNWRTLAEFVCRFVPRGDGLLVDVGSTTSDIIPIIDGRVAAQGTNDTERLLTHELVYSGVGRTPICAVTNALPWHGQPCPIAAELFATTADAYLLLGQIPEDQEADWAADGRPHTLPCARQRLARQLCADSAELNSDDFERMARAVADAQLGQLTDGIAAVSRRFQQPPGVVLVSGAGEFLAQAAAETALRACQAISLSSQLGPDVSRCAPAYAVAVLAAEASA